MNHLILIDYLIYNQSFIPTQCDSRICRSVLMVMRARYKMFHAFFLNYRYLQQIKIDVAKKGVQLE